MMKKILSSNVLRALCIILALLITVLLIWATNARQALRFDMSSTGLMTPSADGKQMIQQVENDVDIYLVTRDTPEDVHHAELISRLADQNKHMDFYVIKSGDSRISALSAAVGQSVSDGQIVVISDKRAVLLTSNDIYTYTVDKTYSLTSYDDITERAVLNAIDYVTRDDMPVIYAVTGHGEAPDDGSIRHALFDIGADFRSLPLTSGDEIPADAACLFVINPTENVGPDVANKILSYLKDGGHLILLTNFTSTLDDLSVVTDYYGMRRQGGLVLDSEAGSYISADYQVYLVPYITDTDLANEMSSALLKAVLPLCESISPAPTTRAHLKVVPFLTTSPSGYRKLNPDKVTTLEKEEQDETGEFILAMSAYEEGQKLTWIATPYVFTANGVNASGGGNNILLEYLLRDIVVSLPNSGSSIPGVSLIAEAPSLPVWPTIGLLLVLPACALIVGIILSKKKAH